jgi:hypothetical protein
VLAGLLVVLPVKRSLAEERVDFTIGYYLEDHDRVEVWSPALLWETNVAKNTVLRLQGVYDVVSGASPTGAPMTRKTKVITRTITTTESTQVVTGYNTISGPTGVPTTQTPVLGTVTKSTTTTTSEIVPYGKRFLPMQEFEDERLGLNLELEHRIGDWLAGASVAYGTESDYESLAGTLKVAREFNHKATVVNVNASFGRDWVLAPSVDGWLDKDVLEGLVSVVQVIDTKTLLTLAGTLGRTTGYLDDQYKFASVDDVIMHERRPDARDKRIAFLLLNRTFDSLHGSAELMYRFYNDSYGLDAHTLGLTWFQHIGKHLILAPSVRYYEQSAADFYAVKFTGKPDVFSSDYRLSKLSTITYGLKVVWKFNDAVQMTLGYDRYEMNGRDGTTPGEAYPRAHMFTAGFKLWY